MSGQLEASVKYSPAQRIGGNNSAPAKGAPPAQRKIASMQPDELRCAMADLGFGTQSGLAGAIGVDRSTVSLWLEGRVGVPRPIAKLIRLMVQYEGQNEGQTRQ